MSPPALLVTRPAAEARRFAARLARALGPEARIVLSPLIEIRQLAPSVDLERYSALVFTSANGVAAVAARHTLDGRAAYCVGDRTAEAARSAGMRAVSAGGDGEALVALVSRTAPEGPLLYACGAERRVDVAARLRAEGTHCDEAVFYEQAPVPPTPAASELLMTPTEVVAPLFSPRTAALLSLAAAGSRANLRLVAMSAAVADAWQGPAPASLRIAARPEETAMLEAATACWREFA